MTDDSSMPEFETGTRRDARTRRETKTHHPVRTTILVMLSLVVVAALAAGGYVWHLARTFDMGKQTLSNALPATQPERSEEAKGAQNFLLIGSDTRNPDSGDARSDTMMLVNIPADHSGVYVMSIMRDTWVEVPGHGEQKINAAMAEGGVSLTVETVQNLLEVPIDHVAIIDFEGFKGLTEALGGVTLKNDAAFTSSGVDGEYFEAGSIQVEGDSALKYVRERYAFADGDYQRVRNQQAFVRGVLGGILSKGTLTNPVKINDLVTEISPFLSVDEGLDASAVGSLGFSLRNVRTSDIHMFTMPNAGVGTSMDGQSIILPDAGAVAQISAALKADDLAEYLQAAEGQN
ncbi:LCP family protein [Arthrobacter sp. zg-Y1143]|uniref:LCP family protein n=1 Tax=Arthrobacter sp. zg-Y1143 TaxID=3049065 RepID=UPI0024C417BE|nr:LCP family protein [Arthrobacter sp. zg-Y1143]MDK1329056.1 LCP family protein [Arthrobacter sp. zg-Y1143]